MLEPIEDKIKNYINYISEIFNLELKTKDIYYYENRKKLFISFTGIDYSYYALEIYDTNLNNWNIIKTKIKDRILKVVKWV